MNAGLTLNKIDKFKIPDSVRAFETLAKSLPKVDLSQAGNVELAQTELPIKHHFSKGVYARELFIPAGAALSGEIHKYSNLNILVKGKIAVGTDKANIKIVEAPFVVVSPPGTKRIAYAIEDCIWITIHGTEETNIDLIKKEFIAESEQEYLDFTIDKQLKLI